jgi:hypothetical protein
MEKTTKFDVFERNDPVHYTIFTIQQTGTVTPAAIPPFVANGRAYHAFTAPIPGTVRIGLYEPAAAAGPGPARRAILPPEHQEGPSWELQNTLYVPSDPAPGTTKLLIYDYPLKHNLGRKFAWWPEGVPPPQGGGWHLTSMWVMFWTEAMEFNGNTIVRSKVQP